VIGAQDRADSSGHTAPHELGGDEGGTPEVEPDIAARGGDGVGDDDVAGAQVAGQRPAEPDDRHWLRGRQLGGNSIAGAPGAFRPEPGSSHLGAAHPPT